jgi:hypothetical protein
MDITLSNVVYGMTISLLVLIIIYSFASGNKYADRKLYKIKYALIPTVPDNNYSMMFDTVIVPKGSSMTNEALSKPQPEKKLTLYNYNTIDVRDFNGYLVDDRGNYYSDNNVSIFPLEMALKLPDRVSAHSIRPELNMTQPYA